MTRFSPKIEIINHFDNLINRVDIDVEDCLEKYNDQQYLGQILSVRTIVESEFNVTFHKNTDIVKFFQDKSQNLWTKSTKIIDYLNQVRMRTIQELRKAQEDTLEYYKLNLPRFKSALNNAKNIAELKSELFAEQFYFQVYFKQSEGKSWPFNLFTFVTDFYMSPSYIDSLE